MKTITTEGQRDSLVDLIQIELLKRGFTAKITTFQEVEKKGSHYIEFESESFQTVPVLFKEIKISNFSTNISTGKITRKDNSQYSIIKFWIQVSARYYGFGGGSNGQNIFDLSGVFYEKESRISEFNIR